MANDPPPSPPPPPQQFFSARNEGHSALISGSVARESWSALRESRHRLSGNEALFIQCMADSALRRIAFNVVERNCRDAFARGEEGLALFMKVRDLVERAHVEEAVSEFDRRFAPMLDQHFRPMLDRMLLDNLGPI